VRPAPAITLTFVSFVLLELPEIRDGEFGYPLREESILLPHEHINVNDAKDKRQHYAIQFIKFVGGGSGFALWGLRIRIPEQEVTVIYFQSGL
jgi:hypothetical protein